MSKLEPTADQLASLEALPADAPVVMVNLLQFTQPDGMKYYLKYSAAVAPLLARVGATVRYSGSAEFHVIGEQDRPWWDVIIAIEYPSPTAFLEMVSSQKYANIHDYRAAALQRAELVVTSPWPATQE